MNFSMMSSLVRQCELSLDNPGSTSLTIAANGTVTEDLTPVGVDDKNKWIMVNHKLVGDIFINLANVTSIFVKHHKAD